MKKKSRKIFKIIATIAVIFLLLFIGILFFINTSQGQNVLKNFIAEQLENNLKVKVEIGSLETNLVSYFNTSRVTLFVNNKIESQPLLSVAKLKVHYNIFDLIFSPRKIQDLYIDSITVNLERDSLGNFILPSLPETTTDEDTSFTLPINILSAEINHVNFIYKDYYIPLNFSFTNLKSMIRRDNYRKTYNLNTSFDSMKLDYFDKPITIKNLSFKSLFNENLSLKIDTFYADISDVKVRGNISLIADSLTGKLNLNGNPQNLLEAISSNSFSGYLKSPLNAELNFSGINLFSAPELSFIFNFPNYDFDGIPVNTFSLNGKWYSDTLSFSDLSFKSLDGFVSSSGWIVFDSLLNHHLNLRANKINIASLVKPYIEKTKFKQSPVNIEFNLNSNGSLTNLDKLKINSGLSINSNDEMLLKSNFNFSDSHLTIKSDSSILTITSDLLLNKSRYKGNLIIDLPDLNPILAAFNINGFSGAVRSVSNLNSRWSKYNFNTIFNSAGIYYKKIKIVDQVLMAININENQIYIDSSFVTGKIYELDTIASIFNFNDINGQLNYSLHAKGGVNDPHAVLAAQIEKPSYASFKFDLINLNASFEKQIISLNELNLKKDSLTLAANGAFNLADNNGDVKIQIAKNNLINAEAIYSSFIFNSFNNYSLLVHSNKFNISSLNEFIPGLEINNGNLSWHLNLNNQDSLLSAYLPFSISNLKRKNLSIDSIHGALKLHNDKFFVDSLILSISGNKAYLNSILNLQKGQDGAYTIDKNSEIEGNISGDNLKLQILNPFIADYASLDGFSNVDLHWNGTLQKPNLLGKISFSDGNINLPNKTNILSALNGDIAFKDTTIEIKYLNALYGKKPLMIEANLMQSDTTKISTFVQVTSNDTILINSNALLKQDSINLTFSGDKLDFGLAIPFFPQLQNIKGILAANLEIKGKINDPNIDGSLQVTGIAYNPNILNLKINNGNIFTHINSNQIVLDSAYFDVGRGQLLAIGNLVYDNNKITDVNIGLIGKNIQLSQPENFYLKLNRLDLGLKLEEPRYKLKGTIQLGTSKFIRNFELTDLWKVLIAKTESVLEGPSDEPLDLITYIEDYPSTLISFSDNFKNLDLDIEMQNSDSVWVDNNVAKFRLHPDITLKGNVETPSIGGRIQFEEDGKVRFLDKEFDIKQGSIEFNNPTRIDPYINLSAESDVITSTGNEEEETYLVKLDALGPMDDLDFNLSAEPILDGKDIITLLSLGITYQQLQSSENADVLLKKRAEVLTTLELSNQMNNYFNKWLGDYIDIDRIGIGGNAFDLSETRFEITKRWSNSVELSYSTAVDRLDKQILKARIKLIKYLYLEGKTDQEDESGADLLFRIKFK